MNNERNSKPVSIDVVEKAKEAIKRQSKADAKRMSLRGAINNMYDDITKMMSDGHDWNSVVSVLKDSGLDIKMATLRTYVYAIKKKLNTKE